MYKQINTGILQLVCVFVLASAMFSVSVKDLHANNEANTGVISGVIVDSETGEGLIGATVLIVETNTGAATDLDGRFRLNNIEEGTYTLRAQYVGYSTQIIEDVEIEAGQVTRLQIALSLESTELSDVVISARAVRDNEAALLAQRQKASQVSDAISSEAMERAGSSSAAEAMERVTGVTVTDGKNVYVRGLGDRYMNTRLNGASLPSSDPDRNSVAFDLFPSSLLENITTTKSSSPDLPGSFTGGSVNISTKAFPDQLEGSLSFSSGFDTELGMRGNHLLYQNGSTGMFGNVGSVSSLPEMFADPDFEVPTLGVSFTNAENAQLLDQASRSFNNVMTPTSVQSPLNSSFSISLGNQVPILGRPFGFVAALSQSRSSKGYTNGTSARYQLTSNAQTTETLTNDFILDDQQGVQEVLWGGLVNLSFKPTDNNELGFNFMYNENVETKGRFLSGQFPRDLPDDAVFQTSVLSYTKRTIQSLQFIGKHVLPFSNNPRFEWDVTLSDTEQDEPDLRYFSNDLLIRERNNGEIDSVYAISPSIYPVPSRIFRNLKEENISINSALTIPVDGIVGSRASIKVGGSYEDKDRSFKQRSFQFRQDGFQFDGDFENFFADDNLGIDEDRSTDSFFRFRNYVLDNTQSRNSYDGSQTVSAAFAMTEFTAFKRLRVSGGVRLETTNITVASADTDLPTGKIKETDYLPSVNFAYELTPSMNVRLAYGKTLARPTSRELAPFSSFDFVNSNVLVGNPELRRSIIHNLDLRWEWFIRSGEVMAVSLFYKDFNDPIEKVFNPIAAASNPEIQFRNIDNATLFGLEIELRRRLDFITDYLEYFDVGFNLSLIHSEVDIAEDELQLIRALNPEASSSRELQGQSPYVVNADISYTNPNWGTRISAFYNVFGPRVSEVSVGGTPNIYEYSRHQLNVVAEQRLLSQLKLKVSMSNLLNEEFKKGHEFKGRDFYSTRYNPGRSFSVGVSYNF